MRQPNPEDVRLAQPHLVLLKSKIRQRGRQQRTHDSPRQQRSSNVSSESHVRDGRFEVVRAGDGHGQAGGFPGGLPRREARPQGMRASDTTPRGMTWDPPAAAHDAIPSRSPDAGFSPVVDPLEIPVRSMQPNSDFDTIKPAGTAFDIDVYDAQQEDNRVPCPDCGRKFLPDRLEAHKGICKKVFQQKRKQFSSAANRLGEFENAGELLRNAQKIEKEKQQVQNTGGKKDGPGNVPAWKQKSLAFRAAILNARATTGDADAIAQAEEINQKLDAAGGADSGMTKCPHCGRTFNKEAGERHIAICLKTFGKKPGGGRLLKGGGRHAAGKDFEEALTPKNTPATRPGSAAVRKPSSHRSRMPSAPTGSAGRF
mmetsp:Transcript_44491/g.118157  ORF Transcript_44491/g.118157 Transcript_44491/m.118157 type:complete len:370 (-) Transcript_44491:368-1477(-)|eukprot:CAMPEP_0194528424 /NCGR_PEP_ID=MMETSP0253-20130528/64829_1 /TAXON_ID=2966 /ORGANISM="Noctiluca scintillans" /LENGTH=369 /DNA_ID=CAMNT_0039373471 /DNA_START=63 /DNA_END=1172 /DNA_ORIENTATION=+